MWKRHNGKNQQWKVVYEGTEVELKDKGLVEDFGLYIHRPFYLVSRLPMKRVVEAIGANNLVIRKYVKGRKAQQFRFDVTSSTIRSEQWTNYCMEIQNNGRSSNARMTSGVNSRWW
jgi:hypothetical protein